MYNQTNLSKKLKQIRELKKITQKELSENINIKYETYNSYETKNIQPNLKTLIKLANYYNVSVDYLLGNDYHGLNELENLSEKQKEVVRILKNFNALQTENILGYAKSIADHAGIIINKIENKN